MSQEKISKALEIICNQGCTAVNDFIDAMERGEHPEEITELSSQEKNTLLDELKKIMSIYNRKHF